MSKAKNLLIAGGAFAVGVFLLVTGWTEYRSSKKLASEGKAVTAEVLGKDIERGRRGRKSYYVEVRFKTDPGAVSEQRVRVNSSQYDAANTGGSVPVHFLPGNPEVCQVGEKVEAKWSGMLWGVGAWLVAGILGFSKPEDEQSDAGDAGNAVEAGGGTAKSEIAASETSADDRREAA